MIITKLAKIICEPIIINFLFTRSAYAPPINVNINDGAAFAAPTNPKNKVESLI